MQASLSLTAATHHAALPPDAISENVLATILAGAAPDCSRVPLDLVMVVDRSGSMSGQKLGLVKKGLHFIISQLTARDSLALVTFDNQIKTEFRALPMSPEGKQKAARICTSIQSGGSTNLSGALIQGIAEVKTPCGEGPRNGSVLIFTDGVTNCGIRETEGIVKCMEGCSAHISRPFSVYTFGFGEDHDADMLRAVADSGAGLYYFIETAETICESFADCLGGLLSVVAQNVMLTVRAHSGCQIAPVNTGYPVSAADGGYTLNIGDINAEESKDIVVCLEGIGTTDPAGLAGCNFELEYYDPLLGKPQQTQLSLALKQSTNKAQCTTNIEVEAHIMRTEVAKAIEQADAHGSRGELLQGKTCLSTVGALLLASPACTTGSVKALREELQQCHSGMQSVAAYANVGSKRMKSARSHWKQKSSMQTPQYSNQSNVIQRHAASHFVATPPGLPQMQPQDDDAALLVGCKTNFALSTGARLSSNPFLISTRPPRQLQRQLSDGALKDTQPLSNCEPQVNEMAVSENTRTPYMPDAVLQDLQTPFQSVLGVGDEASNKRKRPNVQN